MSQVIEYEQPTSAPVPKVAAVGKANAISTGIAAVVTLLAITGIIVPDDISANAVAAITGAVTLYSLLQSIYSYASGYFKKDAKAPEAVRAIQNSADSLQG